VDEFGDTPHFLFFIELIDSFPFPLLDLTHRQMYYSPVENGRPDDRVGTVLGSQGTPGGRGDATCSSGSSRKIGNKVPVPPAADSCSPLSATNPETDILYLPEK